MEKLTVTNQVEIKGTFSQVWDMLTNPSKTKLYMFGCEVVTDWKPGTELLWRGSFQGQELVFVKGYIVDIIPQRLLRYSVIDPRATYPHTPENHLYVTYELTGSDGQILLTVSQDGFETAAEGAKRYDEVYNKGAGWGPILSEIKRLTEAEN